VRARLRARLQPQLEELDIQAHRRKLAEDARTRILHLMDPLNLELRSIHPGAAIDRQYDSEFDGLLRPPATLSRLPTVFHWYTVSWLEAGAGRHPLQLKIGAGIGLDAEGNLGVRTAVMCGLKEIMGDNFLKLGTPRAASVGSVESEEDMQAAIAELASNLPDALEFFHDRLPQ
jgi:hypothetical protein